MFPTGAGTSPLDGFGQHVLHSSVAEMIREKWEVNTRRILEISTGNMVDNHGIVSFLRENQGILQLMNGYTITWRIIPRIIFHSVRIHLNSWDTTIFWSLLTIGFLHVLPLPKWNDPRSTNESSTKQDWDLNAVPQMWGASTNLSMWNSRYQKKYSYAQEKWSATTTFGMGTRDFSIDFSCQDGPF